MPTVVYARRTLMLALAPLVLAGSLQMAAGAQTGFSSTRASGEASLQLAALKDEARSLIVHIDGP